MKSNRIFVGNLIYYANEEILRQLFSEYGTVKSVFLYPKKSFAIVEMNNQRDALNAVEELNLSWLEGKTIFVQMMDGESRTERRDYSARNI